MQSRVKAFARHRRLEESNGPVILGCQRCRRLLNTGFNFDGAQFYAASSHNPYSASAALRNMVAVALLLLDYAATT